MKMKVVIICLLLTFVMCEIGNTNNEDAATPEDVSAFRAIHEYDDAVLFFHDSSSSKSTGFFESIFGLFGGRSDLDEEYQSLMAEKYPTLEIDTNIEALKKTKDDYEVSELPYIIAYHKGKEIWREMPSKKSPEIVAQLIADQDNARLQFYPEGHTSTNGYRKDTIKDIDMNRQQYGRGTAPKRAFIDDNGNPYDSRRSYGINNDARNYDSDYGQLYLNNRDVNPSERKVYSDPSNPNRRFTDEYASADSLSNKRYPDEYVSGDSSLSRRYPQQYASNPSSRRPIRSGLQGGNYNNYGYSNRNIVRSAPRTQVVNSGDTYRVGDDSYGPADVQQGVTVRKYDSDSYDFNS
jgi:hypothetical protein